MSDLPVYSRGVSPAPVFAKKSTQRGNYSTFSHEQERDESSLFFRLLFLLPSSLLLCSRLPLQVRYRLFLRVLPTFSRIRSPVFVVPGLQ